MSEEVKNTEAPAEAEAPNTEQVAQAAPASGPVPTPGAEIAAPDLNINDLNAVKSIIDIATTRGAFKANELEAVGKTYNKLNTFLEHVTKQQQEQQAQGKNNG
jgi:flagellar motor component MotA